MPDVNSPYKPGTPCWVDLMVPDQQAALDFYRGLFGWEGEVGPPETGGYAVCTLGGKPVAGIATAISPEDGPTPPTVWTTYLATSDADADEKRITDNGGTVVMPGVDVLTLGRMALAADPTGAVFGLWQARDFLGAQVVNEPGAFIWSELNTSDPDAAARFYSNVLGITRAPMDGEDGYFALEVDERTVAGMQGLDKMPPGTPSHWLTYFAVDDTDSTVEALIRAGGNVLKPPFDMASGRMAVVRDPQGGKFAVIAPSATESS
ncbi:VOC family protein [Streptomyces sp. BPTC-684]|uniref:VOC family protein n=1 Tax=Streptomyces sp. BPTC-684 TaxID=3043734 RepID=UPI0024B1555F|nr:VOC family protein [Streptomyces sp. BPTC-684]WHM40711.1 VOC family protein [Streptomyces sp. BPTC-684]